MPRSTTELGTYTTVAQSENLPTSPSKQTSIDDDDDDDCLQNEPSPLSAADLALPRTAAPMPPGALYIALVELCERFAYYGLSGPFQNYIANPPSSALPGRLGYGQSRATALTNAFQCWCYVTPVLGAVIADQYWGKYATIKRFSVVYMVGVLILFLSSLTEAYAGIGLIVAMGVIGLGTGGIKSNVSPMIAEQVAFSRAYVLEGRLVDPGVSLQKVFMFFYTCINIGSVAALSTTLLEKYAGFGAAYGVPLLVFGIGFGVLVKGRQTYVVTAPQGGVVRDCTAILLIGVRHKFNLDAARGKGAWSDSFVDEVRRALGACRVFLFFPVYWLTFSQMMNNFISQASLLNLHSLPNDILPTLNPLTLILLIPLTQRFIYPLLHFPRPITRITTGFFFASLAMAYASILQSYISSSPPHSIHIAWQSPAYILIAISEILASITGLELAYARAPKSMKSLVMSAFLLTSAGGSALGILVSPLAREEWLVGMYAGLGLVAAGAGGVFWWVFRGDDGEGDKRGRGEYELVGREREV